MPKWDGKDTYGCTKGHEWRCLSLGRMDMLFIGGKMYCTRCIVEKLDGLGIGIVDKTVSEREKYLELYGL